MHKYTDSVGFRRSGNAVGFTSSGTVVHGAYLSKSKCWVVSFGEHGSLADSRRQTFATERDAAAYAAARWTRRKPLSWLGGR